MRFTDKNLIRRLARQRKTWQSISNSISFALLIIDQNVVLKKLLGLAKRAQKTKLLKFWRKLEFFISMNWRRISVLVNVPLNQCFLQIFQVFWGFWTFWQFFDFLTIFWPTCHQQHWNFRKQTSFWNFYYDHHHHQSYHTQSQSGSS